MGGLKYPEGDWGAEVSLGEDCRVGREAYRWANEVLLHSLCTV